MSKPQSKMFGFITKTWSPVIGCAYSCSYCWAKKLVEKRLSKMLKAYETGFEPKFLPERLKKCESFTEKDFVFVCSMGDFMGEWVIPEWQNQVFGAIKKSSAKFLLLTKNPKDYVRLILAIPENCVLGATIETDRDELVSYGSSPVSYAPLPSERWRAMEKLVMVGWHDLLICLEPIMDFDLADVVNKIYTMSLLSECLKSLTIVIGYDNHKSCLIEPPLSKTMNLIERLEKMEKVKVVRKTLREPTCPETAKDKKVM